MLGVADRRLLVELAGAALDRDAGTALRLVARAADRGVDFGELGRSFLGFLRDLEVIARVSGAGSVDVADLVDATPEEIEEAQRPGGPRGAGAVSGAVRSLGACGRRGVAPADASPAVRDGGARSLRGGADGAAGRPAAAAGRAGGEASRRAPRAQRARAERAAGAGRHGRPAKAPSGQRSWAAPPAAGPAASRQRRPAPQRRDAAPSPDPGGSTAESWRRVMTAFEARGPRLASLLAHAEVVSLSAGEVTLAFASKLEADRAEKARAEIEQVTSATMGRQVKVSFSVGARRPPRCCARRPARRPTPPTPTGRIAKRRPASIPSSGVRRMCSAPRSRRSRPRSHVDPRSERPARDRPAHPERGGAGPGGARPEDRRGRNRRRPLPLHGERPRRGPVADHRSRRSPATRRWSRT